MLAPLPWIAFAPYMPGVEEEFDHGHAGVERESRVPRQGRRSTRVAVPEADLPMTEPLATFALDLQGGSLAFTVHAREPGGEGGTSLWLATEVHLALSGDRPLQLRGSCFLALEDVSRLADVLERLGQRPVGGAGRVAAWASAEDEIELTFASDTQGTAVSGRVDASGSGAQASVQLDDLPLDVDAVASSAASVSAAHHRLLRG